MQTLITREMMGQVGTLNAANPGNMGQITTGSWFTRPIGPYDGTTNPPGWSADSRAANFQSKWDFTLPQYLTALPAGAMSCWVRFTSFGTVGGINVFSSLMRVSTALDGFMVNIGVDINGDAFFSDNNANARFGKAFALNIWYFCLLEFKNININSVGYKFTITPLGGLTQVLRDRTAGYNPGGANQFGIAHFCNLVNSGSGLWDGRIGACGLYHIDAFGDGAIPSDLVAPVEAQHTWYLDTTSGNDGNTGLGRQQAWKSDTKLAAEVLNSGVLGSANPWKFADGTFPPQPLTGAEFCAFHAAGSLTPNGDTVIIDTSGGALSLTVPIVIQGRAPGLLVTSGELDMADIQAFHVIPSVSWVKTAGRTNIYETTDTENFSVLWEIPAGTPPSLYWKSMWWYTHPIGANFAAVAASLDNTAGSFWTDGAKMYVHPFGDTSPLTDGKAYARSRLLGANGSSAFNVSGNNCMLSNLKIGGTAIVDFQNQDFPAATFHYCIQLFINNNKVSNCYLYYGAKHILGVYNGATDRGAFIELTDAEQGSIYTPTGGQTPFVTYADTSGVNPSGMTVQWNKCTSIQNEGVIGAPSGTIDFPDPVWHTHNGLAGRQFFDIFVKNCNFGRNIMSQANNAVVNGLTITDSTIGGGHFDLATLKRCQLDYDCVVPNAAGNVTIQNCLFRPTLKPTNTWGDFLVQGTLKMTNCTFDFRNNPSLGKNAYLYRTAAVVWTFTNNVFVVLPGTDMALHSGLLNTDTLTFNNNVYRLGPADLVALLYNDGVTTTDRTFGQWQLAGFDTGSVEGDPMLDVNFRPQSRIVNIPGVNLGVLEDLSAVVYENRRSAGAYEYILVNCATLLSTVGCFECLPAGQLQLVELALLCEIAKKFFGVPLSNGLIAYWQLGEASGLRVDSVNGFDLAPNGAPLPGNAAGIIDSAVALVAANSNFLRQSFAPPLPAAGYSFNIWINPNSVAVLNPIVIKGTSLNFEFRISQTGAAKISVVVSDNIGGSVTFNSVRTVAAGIFTMVTVTVAAGGTVSLYLNGVLDSTAAMPNQALSVTQRMDLGTNASQSVFFDGLLDETGLWNVPLTAAQVTRLFNAGAGVPFRQLQFS